MKFFPAASLVLITSLSASAYADLSRTSSTSASKKVETMYIIGSGENRNYQPIGSAQRVNSTDLERFEYDDIQRILQQIPGVYVRDEDGFGLRPNIGIRGVSSHRSAKIVLLEDGVLLGPAPYSAPAAYFVPLATRMTGIEVFKGSGAIRNGPFTVGGAVNYLTAEPPDQGLAGLIDIAIGNLGYAKTHGRVGGGSEYFRFLAEGVRIQSSGFRIPDGGGDSGFDKNELMMKLSFNTSRDADIYHQFDIKLGWADELSHESYIGLTDEDFEARPYRRYRVSELAEMDWERTQVEASYGVWFGRKLEAQLTAYRHDFTRSWRKLNDFVDGTNPASVYRSENRVGSSEEARRRRAQLDVLRGRKSSSELGDAGLLLMGTNDRMFVSQGLQLNGRASLPAYEVLSQSLSFGLRLHYDEIERDHYEDTYEMVVNGEQLGALVRTADPRDRTNQSLESALAFSAYIEDTINLLDKFIVTPGLRLEVISMDSRRWSPTVSRSEAESITSEQTVWIPGLGLQYQLMPKLRLLAGVHRGFSPIEPGQPDVVEPELSTNYELGAHYSWGPSFLELIGYFNNYDNYLVSCGHTNCNGYELAEQINAGAVYVYGAELQGQYHVQLPGYIELELRGQYTLTLSEFQSTFESDQAQFETVQEGDRLPYVPEHQANVSALLSRPVWSMVASISTSYTYVDRMRDRASTGSSGAFGLTDEDFTDAQHIMDLSLQLDITEQSRGYLRIDNLLDRTYLASRRPIGARAGRPFTIQLGYTHRFSTEGAKRR